MREPQSDLELVVTEWLAALGRGDPDTVARRLNEGVVWRGIREDFVCHGRREVLELLREALRGAPAVEAIEVVAGERAVALGIRSPDLREIGGVPIPGQLFNVFELRDGRIVAIQDHVRREDALRAAGAAAPDWH